MPDNKENKPQPTKTQLAGYIRSVNQSAKNLSDDEILDRLVSKQPKIAKMVSDYENPSLQGPIPLKNKFPMISDISKSVGQMGQAMPEKSLVEDFQDLEVERAKASIAKQKYNTPVQPGGFNISNIEQEKKAKQDAIKYEQKANTDFEKFKVKYNDDAQIQSLKNNAFSKLNEFIAKDNLGADYVDNAKVRGYIRKTFPQAANTQFEDYVVQNISSDLMFKSKEPKIKEKVLKLAKEKNISVPENFLDLNSEVAKTAQKISDKVVDDLTKVNSSAESNISILNKDYKFLTESISKKYNDKDFIEQNFKSDEEYKASYQSDMSKAFDDYSREFSRVKSNYMSLSQKLQGDYKRGMNELQVNTEKQKSEIGKLLQQSLIDLNEEENNTKLKNLDFVSSIFDKQVGAPISSKFILALNSGLAGNWLNAVATNLKMESNSQLATDFQDFASNLTKKLSTPKSEINSIKDLIDPTKFALSSGQMIGQMLPAIGAGIGAAYATGGTGIIPVLASGTIGWFDEASQARASNYQSMIEKGLDPEDAKNKANNTYSGYLLTYPLALVESAALFGKFGKGSMLRRLTSGILADIPSETGQELVQNEADESIVMNRPMDFGKMFDLNNVYKTALNVAPASIIMPIPGSINESIRENEPISQAANWALRVSTAPIQNMAKNVMKNGLYANMAVLESMRHNGVITEDGMNQMKEKFQEVSSDMEAAKVSGLNKKQQSVYAGLMGNIRSMEESVAELSNQEMSEESKTKALDIANKRVQNSKDAASDYLNNKNGNFAEVQDAQGDTYIVSHEQLDEMLSDESFQQDVREGNARVELNYNKKAGELLGGLSKKLLSLNKNYNSGLTEYSQSEKNLNALRQKLGLPDQPTSSTTIDGLIGQTVTHSTNKFPTRINITGKLEVQNGQLVIIDNNGGLIKFGKAKEFNGVSPSFLDIKFEPQKYEGPKVSSEQAKLPSLLTMFAGKIEPKTLVDLLSNAISDVKKSQITKMVKAFDSAYKRKEQQKSINESLPKPNKLVEVEQPEVGTEYDGDEVASNIAQVGDRTSKTLLGKILSFVQKDFVATTIDLDDLHENSEEFRNRVEQERGEKVDRFKTDYSNTEDVPAVLINGKVEDGMGRLARLYLNGQKVATVFENIKTKKDATTKSKREIQTTDTEGDISEYQGVEAEQEQEATQADIGNRNIIGKAVTVTPAIAKITSENINNVYSIKGNSVQKKVLNDIKKVIIALKSIVNITVNIHNQESFTEALLEAGATREDSLSRGFYVSIDGSVHLNFDTVKSDTMLHEGFHPILDLIAANNPDFIKNIFNELSAIPEAKSIIESAREQYEGNTTQMKEAITDFVAGVADRRIVINPSNFDKIKSFVLNVLKKLGLGEGMILMNIEGKPDLIKLANFVTEKFTTGKQITKEELELTGKPVAPKVKVQLQKATPTKSSLQAIKDNPLFENLSDNQKQRLSKGITIWQQWATSYGLLGKEAKIAEEYKTGYVSQELYLADKSVKNIIKQLEIAKKSGITVTDNDITEYITGNSVPPNMPDNVKLAIGVMRSHIDSMTEELILNGAITDPQEIQEFRDNKGKYLGRFYDMFINGKGLTLTNIVEKLKNVDENVIDRAYTLIRAEISNGIKKNNPNLSQEELNKVIDNHVDDILNSIVESTSSPYAKTPIKGSVNMKALLARQDIVEPIRALMGEIKNPISRYYATVAKMASVAGGIRYLNSIREIGMGNFLFEENDPNRPKGTVKISSESNKNLAPIAGLYSFPEIRDELNNYMMSTGKDNILFDKIMGTAKYMNTVGNLPTHVKNFTSNIGILVNNGYVTDIPAAIEFIINEPNAFKKAYEELRKSGTLNNNINATELKSYFEKNSSIDKILSNKFKKQGIISKTKDTLTAIYNVEDDVFKVLAYIIESQRYAKAEFNTSFSNLSNDDKDIISKKSVEIIKSILPLFSRVPPLIKGMNKYLYLGTFMTYTAESIRISKNTLLLAIKELSSEKTRGIGAKRLSGIITWNSAYGFATVSSASAVGAMATGQFSYWYNAIQQLMSDDDDDYKKRAKREKSIRLVARDYNVSSDIYLTQASSGKLIYHDIGSINPYQFLTNFLNRFDQLTKDEKDGYTMDFVKAVGQSLYPFVKTDFIADRLIDVFQALFSGDKKTPVDAYGNKIYGELDNAYEKYYKLSKYAAGAFTPGMVKNVSKAVNLFKEGDSEGSKAEVISTLTVRKNIIDVNKWFYTKLAKGTNPMTESISEQYKNYSRITYKNVSAEEKEKQYQESFEKIKKGIYTISENFKAAIDLGVDENDLIQSMVTAKMRTENIAAVIESLTMDIDKIDPDLFLMRKD